MDDEALQERAAIIAEGCEVSQEEGLRRAVRWRATLKFDGETREVSGVYVSPVDKSVDNLPEELGFD